MGCSCRESENPWRPSRSYFPQRRITGVSGRRHFYETTTTLSCGRRIPDASAFVDTNPVRSPRRGLAGPLAPLLRVKICDLCAACLAYAKSPLSVILDPAPTSVESERLVSSTYFSTTPSNID